MMVPPPAHHPEVPTQPMVLEFNTRFGDPETQAILVRLESDIVDLFTASIDGTADQLAIRIKPGASVCVIAASGGYPGKYASGLPISGLGVATNPDVVIFHSGTGFSNAAEKNGAIVTAGGRVLSITAVSGPQRAPGTALKTALASAYAALEKISFDGMQFRRDIGWRALRDGL
jgi:phosphoribosylamine--glycine ligase